MPQDVDARNKSGHDGGRDADVPNFVARPPPSPGPSRKREGRRRGAEAGERIPLSPVGERVGVRGEPDGRPGLPFGITIVILTA